MPKLNELLGYIEKLSIGTIFSLSDVKIATSSNEAMAYRTIKEAENRGLIQLLPNKKLERIAQTSDLRSDKMTLADIAQLTESDVLAGQEGLFKEFTRFTIGAMTKESMPAYLLPYGLVVVGDRNDIHQLALEKKNALLITGGFGVSEEIRQMANQLQLPVLVTDYDTFTVATLINKALSTIDVFPQGQLVADSYQDIASYGVLSDTSCVRDYLALKQTTNRVRFPVVDKDRKLIGMISVRDMVRCSDDTPINCIMSTHPVFVRPHFTIEHAIQKMVKYDFDLLPVIDDTGILLGIITRRVIMQKWLSKVSFADDKDTPRWSCIGDLMTVKIEGDLVGKNGYADKGRLQEILTQMHDQVLLQETQKNVHIEQIMIYWLESVKRDEYISVKPQLVQLTENRSCLELAIYSDEGQVGKLIFMSRLD